MEDTHEQTVRYKQPYSESKESQDNGNDVIHPLGVTISAINATKDLVPTDLAKGILGTIANILILAWVC